MEKDLQKNCIDYAKAKGYLIYSINPPDFKRMTYGTKKQLPDLHIVEFNAYFELKDDKYRKNHPERQAKQLQVRKELCKHGAKAYKVSKLENFIIILDFLNGKKRK